MHINIHYQTDEWCDCLPNQWLQYCSSAVPGFATNKVVPQQYVCSKNINIPIVGRVLLEMLRAFECLFAQIMNRTINIFCS